MSTENKGRVSLAAAFAVIIAAFFVVAWPPYRNTAAMNHTIETVHHRVQNQEHELKSLKALARRLSSIQTTIEHDLREIPTSTDMAFLITALTVEVDQVTVYDQTFRTSKVRPLNSVEDGSIFVLPVAIDMDATFAVVSELLTKVEHMRRLVRVSNLLIEKHPTYEHLVRATVDLELVFEPPLENDNDHESGVDS